MSAWTLLFYAVMSYLLGAVATSSLASLPAFDLVPGLPAFDPVADLFELAGPVSLVATVLFLLEAALVGVSALAQRHSAATEMPRTSRNPE